MSKVSWRDILGGFQETVFKNKLTFMKKSCTAYNNSPMHCKDWQVLRDLFSTINHVNDKEMILMAGATET